MIRNKLIGLTLASLFLSSTLVVVLFGKFWNSAFAMDDPILIGFLENPNESWVSKVFGDVTTNRYRPVANTFYWISYLINGENYSGWLAVNMLFLVLISVLFSYLTYRLSRSVVFALSASLLLVTSRFLQYGVTQAVGLMELIALMLFLILVIGLVLFFEDNQFKFLIMSGISFILLVFTHERFQLLVLALLYFVVYVASLSKRQKFIYSMLVVSAPALLSFMKVFVFQIPLAVGPGSTTSLGFSLDTTFRHLVVALLNLVGVNVGEPHLSGLILGSQDIFQQLLSVAILITLTIFVMKYIGSKNRPRGWSRFSIFLILAFIGLLLPIIVTSRLELRWLTTLYMLEILALAVVYLGLKNSQETRNIVFGAFIICNVLMNFTYSQNMDGLYFRGNQIYAEATLKTFKPLLEEADAAGKTVFVIDESSSPGLEGYVSSIIESNTAYSSSMLRYVTSYSNIGTQEGLNPVVVQFDAATTSFTALGR